MDELTLGLPGVLREHLEAEAAERGVPVDEHVRDIIEVHCRGEGTLDSPAIDVAYTHSVLERRDSSTVAAETGEELASFTYGSRSIRS